MHRRITDSGSDALVIEWEAFGVDWVASWLDRDSDFTIEAGDRTFRLSEIGSYWIRRDPVLPEADSIDAVGRYVASQQAIFQRWMLHWLANVRPGVDPLAVVATASAKPWQQTVAARRGLALPCTYSGSSPGVAYSWMESTDGGLCIKAIEAGRVKLSDGQQVAHYTSIFTRRSLPELESLRECPVTLQSFVSKAYEVRATVVGSSVFACAIDTTNASDDAKVDWRHYDWANTPYRRIDLPDDVSTRLCMVLQDLGLQYGAFDLVVTPQGDHVFLEVNPTGQFLWIEDLTDLPIAAALSRHLIGLCSQ